MRDEAPMTTTELGLEVPVPPGQEWREHTAARWKERDPESFAFALYLVRELGLINKSKIEKYVSSHREVRGLGSISRNSIIALFNDREEFKPGEIDDIIRRSASLLSADALGKVEELLDKAQSAKDLGAVAMALTAVYNVKQISSGGATSIKGSTSDGVKAMAFDEFRRRAQQKLQAAPLALEPAPLHREVEVVPIVRTFRSQRPAWLPSTSVSYPWPASCFHARRQ